MYCLYTFKVLPLLTLDTFVIFCVPSVKESIPLPTMYKPFWETQTFIREGLYRKGAKAHPIAFGVGG